MFNEKWATNIGYSLEELYPVNIKTWHSVVHPGDRLLMETSLSQHFSGEVPYYECEYRIMHKDGHWVWIHDRGSVVTWTIDNKPLLMYGTQTDISTRKQFERAFNDNQAFLEDVFQSIQDGVCVINKDLTIRHSNAIMNRWFKISPSNSGKKCYESIYNASKPCACCSTIRCFNSGKTEFDIIPGPSDSGIEWMERYSYPLKNQETGEIEGAISFSRDITNRKSAEDQLLQTNHLLEKQTAFANTMAAEAEMANAAKSNFLANISHEIRTPMNGIIGMTGLLLETNLTDEQRQLAEIIKVSSDSLLTLVSDLLDFSKIEAGKFDLEKIDFNLYDVLEKVSNILVLKAEEKKLEFICAPAPEIPFLLKGDPNRLFQILTNLAGNAVKFTQSGEVNISIELISQKDSRVNLRFSVRDTGIGIPIDKQSVLFSKFSQVDPSTTRKFGGTGLGLAISKQLVGLMGGEIGVLSPILTKIKTVQQDGMYNKRQSATIGAEFWFTVTFDIRDQKQLQVVSPAILKNHRILVVDDNLSNSNYLRSQICSLGIEVLTTNNYGEVVSLLYNAVNCAKPFTTAFVSVDSPINDFEKLCTVIKGDKALVTTKLVAMVSVRNRSFSSRLSAVGFDNIMIKPIFPISIYKLLSVQTSIPQNTVSNEKRQSNDCKQDYSRYKILLVEDNITNQEVILRILKRYGFQTELAVNGYESIILLQKHNYDLVFMDIQMPEMDGYETVQHIRHPLSNVLNHTITIIAMTAHTMQGDAAKCLKAGMNDYIPKPININSLLTVIDKWLVNIDRPSKEKPAQQNISPDTKTPSLQVFNKEAFLQRMSGNNDIADSIIEAYLKDIPNQIAAFHRCLPENNFSQMKHIAHSIKGASANTSAEMIHSVAIDLESNCKAETANTIPLLLRTLEIEFYKFQKALL